MLQIICLLNIYLIIFTLDSDRLKFDHCVRLRELIVKLINYFIIFDYRSIKNFNPADRPISTINRINR